MDLKISIRTFILFGLLFICNSLRCFSQNHTTAHNVNIVIPEVALLGFVSESQETIDLYCYRPKEAGHSINNSSLFENKIWLNYSSVISETSRKRKVTAMLKGNLPDGLALEVQVSDYSGSGKGSQGIPIGAVILSNQPSDIIVDIGSCYTGTGVNNGHSLSYRLVKENTENNFALLSHQPNSVDVIYTITE
jgi:hypothetical protein